jgi:hypothetical protein
MNEYPLGAVVEEVPEFDPLEDDPAPDLLLLRFDLLLRRVGCFLAGRVAWAIGGRAEALDDEEFLDLVVRPLGVGVDDGNEPMAEAVDVGLVGCDVLGERVRGLEQIAEPAG